MTWLEGLLVQKASKLVYVTRVAAERSQARHANLANVSSIRHIYPGAWDFQLFPHRSQKTRGDYIDFFHVGTLYSNRNLDLFFQALDHLQAQGNRLATKVRVFNKGDLAVSNPEDYRKRGDFFELPIGPRLEALRSALGANFLLLVQHRDSNGRVPAIVLNSWSEIRDSRLIEKLWHDARSKLWQKEVLSLKFWTKMRSSLSP